ncbi:MAG: DUF1684 domain-containing protein [Anaerolineales bacterium]|nr:DUF1684 domain-containing protein [Anaerolineales bacterium]
MSTFLTLYDYRRKVSELYYYIRHSNDPPELTLQKFREEKDRLFAHHPQSALTESQKKDFQGLRYFDYDPAYRFALPVHELASEKSETIELRQDGTLTYASVGRVEFDLFDKRCILTIFWLKGYGGGLFLPFRDQTAGTETYGGGRYLLDTVKGADLGKDNENLVLDFNYAYHPSCAYNSDWHCPLAPAENLLDVPIRAGERLS